MRKIACSLILISVALVLFACQPTADFDIRGDWDYTMIADDGNTYDTGTITFSGSPTSGTYIEQNIYQIEYEGAYEVNGTSVTLTGDESWEGTITDADHMNGLWRHDDGFSGTWIATRLGP